MPRGHRPASNRREAVKALDKRLSALEAALPETQGRVALDKLSDADLERLEAILMRWRPDESLPLPVDQMPDDDLRFIASIQVAPV